MLFLEENNESGRQASKLVKEMRRQPMQREDIASVKSLSEDFGFSIEEIADVMGVTKVMVKIILDGRIYQTVKKHGEDV